MEDERFLTIDDAESKILEMIDSAEDAADIEKLSRSLEVVHNSRVNEVQGEAQIENEKKGGFWRNLATIGAAVLTTAGVIGAAFIKGEYDLQYQDKEHYEEKNENYMGRGLQRHRGPK